MDICAKAISRSYLLKLEKRSVSHNSVDSVAVLKFDAQLFPAVCLHRLSGGVLDNWGCGGHSTYKEFEKSSLFHQSLVCKRD